MPTEPRPGTLHASRSFTRMENATPPSQRKRASTLQDSGIPSIPEARKIDETAVAADGKPVADVFENTEEDDAHDGGGGTATPGPETPLLGTFDELPIEIRSLAERFLESLSAKVHPTPLNADNLSDMFQDFYERAAAHIGTHIASLASRIGRTKSPSPLAMAKGSLKGRPRSGSGAKGSSDDLVGSAGGEMLTASEVADRKRARRLLELKRFALEEAVEKGVCEKVYDKIWKHRSTDDEARDEKLRSRTAALALVGIGLKELHMDSDPAKADVRKTAAEKEDEIFQSLAPAREALEKMNEEHSPRGKLQHLLAAHKSIVETLSQIYPSTSSADEILPTLIYTLITSNPEEMNVVSNLNFIQRFRAASKLDGESSYCLVNLEASISFLETVDLSSLRADELPEGPAKSTSRPSTPSTEASTAANRTPLALGISPVTVTSTEPSTGPATATSALAAASAPATRPAHQRRLSTLVQQQATRLEAGREQFLSAADRVYDSINGTLDNSFAYIFGRFKEQQQQLSTKIGSSSPRLGSGDQPARLPKTLEDARRLVNSPSMLSSVDDEDALSSLSARSSGRSSPRLGVATDDPLGLLGGATLTPGAHNRRPTPRREHSVESTRSASSGKRVAFAAATNANITSNPRAPEEISSPAAAAQDGGLTSSPAALFASINPLNRFGMPAFPRFGRPAAATSGVPASPTKGAAGEADASLSSADRDSGVLTATSTAKGRTPSTTSENGDDDDENQNAREALATLRTIAPPRKKFLEVASAQDLRIGEVEDLLREYRRLAKAIGEAIA